MDQSKWTVAITEAIFAIAQLTPNYRARPIIQQGTGFFFFYTCLVQTAWTILFSFKLFTLSFVAAVLALLSMAWLLASQHFSRVRGRKSLIEYWLFRFPFYLHCGWLILCSVVQFSLLFRHLTSNVGVQLAADVVALGAMLPAATFFLTGQPSGPDFVIPLVIIWSYVSYCAGTICLYGILCSSLLTLSSFTGSFFVIRLELPCHCITQVHR